MKLPHHFKNLLKPKQLAQLEKQDDKTLETDRLVWTGKDVKEALKTFKPEGKTPPKFWLDDKRIEVLCNELASSTANGWARMHNHAMMASLIKDTIHLLDTGQMEKKQGSK